MGALEGAGITVLAEGVSVLPEIESVRGPKAFPDGTSWLPADNCG